MDINIYVLLIYTIEIVVILASDVLSVLNDVLINMLIDNHRTLKCRV